MSYDVNFVNKPSFSKEVGEFEFQEMIRTTMLEKQQLKEKKQWNISDFPYYYFQKEMLELLVDDTENYEKNRNLMIDYLKKVNGDIDANKQLDKEMNYFTANKERWPPTNNTTLEEEEVPYFEYNDETIAKPIERKTYGIPQHLPYNLRRKWPRNATMVSKSNDTMVSKSNLSTGGKKIKSKRVKRQKTRRRSRLRSRSRTRR